VTAWLDLPVFGTPDAKKAPLLLDRLGYLDSRHRAGCPDYAAIAASQAGPDDVLACLADVPFLSVDLFKYLDLRTVPRDEVSVVLRSSGTGPRGPSRVALDRPTARLQSRIVTRILGELLGPVRLPMLIIDAPPRPVGAELPGRAVAAVGFMHAGRDHAFALDEQGQVVEETVRRFAREHGSAPCFVFGLTSTIWECIASGRLRFEAPGAVVMHGGGWKKLERERVDRARFSDEVKAATGAAEIRNYYGLVEQVGTIFLEDAHGSLCAPAFADVLIRAPGSLEPCPPGTTGLVQVLSAVPESYPGHSLLTGDLGRIVPPEPADPWCGTRLEVHGRAPEADLRGCGDLG
jgi:hypothetical protein